ncbi:MAG: hypothetical protein HYX23_01495 [Candidatus Zambryskibacteria bacterium]|nr:hypothetical protein [Candidatus Zambryskibacteria bacterium]
MNKEEVLKLAKLVRIKLSDTEVEILPNEFESILNYVGEVKRITSSNTQLSPENFSVRNVMRADGEGHESGIYTNKILSEAPARDGDYFQVKKIL